MDTGDTKSRILSVALELFSTKGYEGVTVKQIAEGVGIKDSSLYKHFKSKQAIFDTLLTQMNARFEETVAFHHLPQGEIEKVAREYGRQGYSLLKKACKTVFLFFLTDDKASKFRKVLMIEQFKNPNAAQTFRSWFADSAIRFQEALFAEMMRQGYFKRAPVEIIALQFYAPFFLLLCLYDTMPGKEEQALSLLMAHIDQFTAQYKNENGEKQ